jgi:putative ABC transport system ATP-binding protein
MLRGADGRDRGLSPTPARRVRAAIVACLLRSPSVLHVLCNLDEDTRDEIIGLLEKLWQDSGVTLVLVTHDSSIARRAQRLGTMKNGKLTVKQAV